jgi:hypothetical protein
MIVSYDVDGVLAEKPPASKKSWGKMNGEERRERKQYLNDWYKNAASLIQPKEDKFYAISARKAEPHIYKISMDWLNANYNSRVIELHLLRESRSIKNVAAFKSEVIINLNIERHYEDNKKVLKEMEKLLPPWIELYFWEKGMIDPIPFKS